MKGFSLGLLAAAAMWAQGTVTIYGTVSDATGSLIPGTTVRILQVETGQTRSVVSNERGDYVATQLPIGVYTVTAERTAGSGARTMGRPVLHGRSAPVARRPRAPVVA